MTLQERTKQVLATEDVTQHIFARLVRLSESMTSKVLDGTTRLTPNTRRRFAAAVTFIEVLAERNAPVPVCFHNFRRIEKLWVEFQKTLNNGN